MQDALAKSLPFLTDELLIADDISYEGLLATCQGRESYLSAMRDWQRLVPERLEDFKVMRMESWRLNPGVVTARCACVRNGEGLRRCFRSTGKSAAFQGGALASSRRFHLPGSFASCHRMRRCCLGPRPLDPVFTFLGLVFAQEGLSVVGKCRRLKPRARIPMSLSSGPRRDAAGRRDDAEFGGEGSLARRSFESVPRLCLLQPPPPLPEKPPSTARLTPRDQYFCSACFCYFYCVLSAYIIFATYDCRLLTNNYVLPNTECQLFTTYYSLLVAFYYTYYTYHSLPTTDFQLLTAY